MERYDFDRKKIYQLVAITDAIGRDRSHARHFYMNLMRCKAINLHYDKAPVYGSTDEYRMRMVFIQNEAGMPVYRSLHTSVVHQVEETEHGLRIHTDNSIYVLENAELKEVKPLEASNLIELYLSMQEDFHFAEGFYHDENGIVYQLEAGVHTGMTTDSVLVGTEEGYKWGDFVCRYFLESTGITFYDTLYGQQDYSVPMLIYNVGNADLIIRFEGCSYTWTIPAGESKRIIPYQPEGSDLRFFCDEKGCPYENIDDPEKAALVEEIAAEIAEKH